MFWGVTQLRALKKVEMDSFLTDLLNFVYNTTFLLLNHVELRNRGCLKTSQQS